MYDLEPLQIHPTLQLKINQLLSKPSHKLDFTNAQFIMCQNQDRSLSILHSSNHLQSYLKLYVLRNSKKAKVIIGADNKLKQILSLGGNIVTLYTASQKGQINKIASKQLDLDSKQEVLHLSDPIEFRQNFGIIILTNYGRTHLCKITQDEMHIQTLQINNQIYSKIIQFALKPFLAPPQQYQYCSTAISRIDLKNDSLYLYVIRQLNICKIFMSQMELSQQERQPIHKYSIIWNCDVEAFISKNGLKVKEVWFTKIFELSNESEEFLTKDKINLLAGISYEDQNGLNFAALLYLRVDFVNGKIEGQYFWNIPITANFFNSQVLLFNNSIYLLAHGIYDDRSQFSGKSMLFELSLREGLLLKKKIPLQFPCSLSKDEQYMFLVAETEAFILARNEQSKSFSGNQRLEERFQMLNKQYLRDIQRQIIQNNPQGIIQILHKKKQKVKRFTFPRAQFEDQQRQLEQRTKLDIFQLEIDIASKLLELGIFRNEINQIEQYQQIFTKNDDKKLAGLFIQCLDNQNPQIFLQVLQAVIAPSSRKQQLLLPYIRQKFENIIKQYLQYLGEQQRFVHLENKLLLLSLDIIQYPIQMFSYYVRQKNKQRLFFSHWVKSSTKDQNLLIVLYCQSQLIKDQDVRDHIIMKQSLNCPKIVIHEFIFKLLNYNLQLISERQSLKPTLSLIQYLQPYYEQIYKYLQNSYPSIAWILLLKMKQRQNYQIIEASQKMTDPIYVKSILHSAQDAPNAEVKSIQIMADICSHLGLCYIDVQTFINSLKFEKQFEKQLFKTKKSIPMKWWNDLKSYCLSEEEESEIKKIQKKLKLQ